MMDREEKIKKAVDTIYKEIPFVDIKQYSHNIISLKLQLLDEMGQEELARKIIRDTILKYKGWGHILKT